VKQRLWMALAGAVLALISGTAVVGHGHAQEKSVGVTIDNFSFAPASVTVPLGATVQWINRDDIPHTVVSDDNGATFKSKALDTDDKFAFTFAKPGTYSYFCSIHPRMTGKIVVQ
jgi:plastocyanin